MDSHSHLFKLNAWMWKMQHGEHNITTYYNALMTVWQELDLFDDDQWEGSNENACSKQVKMVSI